MKQNEIDGNSKEFLNLEDILDLTVLDIFILFYLIIFSGGSVRFSILQDLNAFFNNSKQNFASIPGFKKKLSSSSFYNILKKLEKKGLTSTIDKGGNVRTVEATPLARQALKLISLFTLSASFDMKKEFNFLEEILQKEFHSYNLNSLFFISLNRFYLVPIVKMFNELDFIETLYVLADEDILERYFTPNLKEIKLSTTLNSQIREPNDIFDATFIYRYYDIKDFYGMSKMNLLKEAVRVTKPGQPIILLSWTGKEDIDNSIFGILIKELLDASPFFFQISKQVVLEDMKAIGILDPEIYDLRGGFLVWGETPIKDI